jgi:DUF1707 SHOCT-like domain
MGESPDLTIRVSDAERDLAVAALWEHLGTGRLKPGEHEERCARAMAATTRADLETLFADLPAPHPDLSAAVTTSPAGGPAESALAVALASTGCGVLTLGIPAAIILTVVHGMWWMFLPPVGLTTLVWVLSDAVERRRARAVGRSVS